LHTYCNDSSGLTFRTKFAHNIWNLFPVKYATRKIKFYLLCDLSVGSALNCSILPRFKKGPYFSWICSTKNQPINNSIFKTLFLWVKELKHGTFHNRLHGFGCNLYQEIR
jgi:hypothetical protein